MRIYINIYIYGLCKDIEATCGYTYIYIYRHIYPAEWGLGLKGFEFQRFWRA